jgi:hypothetical protein
VSEQYTTAAFSKRNYEYVLKITYKKMKCSSCEKRSDIVPYFRKCMKTDGKHKHKMTTENELTYMLFYYTSINKDKHVCIQVWLTMRGIHNCLEVTKKIKTSILISSTVPSTT